MKHLVTRIAIASLIAALASTAALVKTDSAAALAAAPAGSQVQDVDTRPTRILQLEWITGQPAWREATGARLLRSTFRFSQGGRFTLIQPGFAPVAGRFRVSGNTAQFSGQFVQSYYPSGETRVAVAGTLDLKTGRTRIGYEARSIMVSVIGEQKLTQSKVMSYRAELVLRRI